jgi:hypothetical protein
MGLHFKHDSDVYDGFTSYREPAPEGAAYAAVVMNEGEPEMWWLDADPSFALNSLKVYYRDHCSWVQPFKARVFRPIPPIYRERLNDSQLNQLAELTKADREAGR